MKKIIFLITIASIGITTNLKAQEKSDDLVVDGIKYRTVKIGAKIWMAENLNFITNKGSWCYKDKKKKCEIFGRLYDWEAANKACPSGWHLPSDEEWEILINKLGGENVAMGKLKSKSYWNGPAEYQGDNSSGFAALPGGCRYANGEFNHINLNGSWWSSTKYSDDDRAWQIGMSNYGGKAILSGCIKTCAMSVRCVKD